MCKAEEWYIPTQPKPYQGKYDSENPCIFGTYMLSDAYGHHADVEYTAEEWKDVPANPYKHKWVDWRLCAYKPIIGVWYQPVDKTAV